MNGAQRESVVWAGARLYRLRRDAGLTHDEALSRTLTDVRAAAEADDPVIYINYVLTEVELVGGNPDAPPPRGILEYTP
jgi:hypothetical protein